MSFMFNVVASLTNSYRFIHCDSISKLDHLEFIYKEMFPLLKRLLFIRTFFIKIFYMYIIFYIYMYI